VVFFLLQHRFVNRFGNVFSINTTIYVVLRRMSHCWGQQTNICRLIWNVFFIIQDKSFSYRIEFEYKLSYIFTETESGQLNSR